MTRYKLGWFPEDVIIGYLSYPYSDNPELRTEQSAEIASQIILGTKAKVCPLSPHYAFDMLLKTFIEQGNWMFVADWELATIEMCDIFILGLPLDYGLSPGMVWEAAFARRIRKPIMTVDEVIEKYG